MRNLKNVHHSVVPFSDLPLTATVWDAATDALICACGPSPTNATIQLKRLEGPAPGKVPAIDSNKNQVRDIVAWDAPCPLPDLACDKILDLHYFSDTQTACLVLEGGDVIIVREQPLPGENQIEILGSVDVGISAAGWSPDEELLAICTRSNTLLFMSREFESITEATLTPEDVNVSAHVSVGWGKRETQFQGKRAKALRDPTVPEKIDQGTLSPYDNGRITITWRGDGAYLAISTIESNQRRLIRVYSREGMLDNVSEPVDGLEGALSWRPAGNLMATIQRFEDHAKVVFFERNGLRHGEFPLRVDSEDLKTWARDITVRWNIDSTVLAVCFTDRVQLWTMGNYHYYLKQELLTSSSEDRSEAVSVTWHTEKALSLSIFYGVAGQRLEYIFDVAKGSTSPPNDFGAVAVIDGKTLKLTPLRLANTPPPMALHEAPLSNVAVDAAISCSGSRIAVLHRNQISLFEWKLDVKPIPAPTEQKRLELPVAENAQARQIAFLGDRTVIVLVSEEGSSTIFSFNFDSGELLGCDEISGPGISRLFPREDHSTICYESYDNSVSESVSLSEDNLDLITLQFQEFAVFPVHCPWVEVVNYNGESIAFGLSRNGSLYANSKLLAKGCTSFLVSPAHVIFTTTQHLLKFIHMGVAEELEVPSDDPERDERCRSIERGARLVTVMPTSLSLALQMPRGNLETIFPRALVLAGIRRSIAKKKYKSAFLACRNQRVDMNILHDHAPQQFMENIDLFINQIKRPEHIDLFLSQLREEDVSQMMYKETIRTSKLDIGSAPGASLNSIGAVPQSSSPTSKVNRICDAFLDALQGRESTHIQNIISAHVCKSPPDLDAGLLVVGGLRVSKPELAEKAVEHICFLADVNRLYDNALGLYDLELALLVAQQSQKDPREYLPFLQKHQEMSDLRRKFSIDNHLGRHTKALLHLRELKAFDEFTAYTVKYELYKDALSLCRYDEKDLSQIMRLYADFLSNNSKFKEAGITYEYLSDYTSASEAYQRAHLWRESLSCAMAVPFSESQLRTLADLLAEDLAESKDYYAAATIYLDHLSDIETASRTFCRGYHFAEATRVLGLHRRQDLVESVIDVGLAEGLASTTELLSDCKGQIAAQVPRIRELRVKKTEDPLAFFEGADPSGADIPDNVSLAPSDTSTARSSLFTRYTNRTGTVDTSATRKTSKNRRREERKRARGKKGSVYEEEYLVNSVGRLIERVSSVRDEVQRLVEGLLRRGMRERALAVEQLMSDVVTACETCIPEVFELGITGTFSSTTGAWGGAANSGDGRDQQQQQAHQKNDDPANPDAAYRPTGADGVFWESLEERKAKKDPPVIKSFERLSLLGA
ncbi:IkappaB kinase complex, IKAP component [Xylona heveae TC161]|uniref:Elongator complex protein 1 n=1 Tax=Xylona heveae (strain CBS 132557 / TC161) TaxID=1328760 RepID=A0A165J594_XYLHT|nr:IkappaB kinase complex, IKAP component [Xylona heveae TC161]KZF25746.1 IkappaB kinase complex, IKAP component [Xylona heveae TC161]